MSSEQPFSPETAAAVWRRAAQLQSEAAQRLEERSRQLSASAASPDFDSQDLSAEEVRAAAAEVGIGAEFIALAISEMRADPAGALPERLQDAATRFLGTPERSLELSRRVERPIAEVYAALQRVVPAHPWLLALRDVSGDPLAGGILIFDIPEYSMTITSTQPLSYYAYAVDVQQLQFLLREVEGSNGQACDIMLRAGLQRSVRRNFRFGSWTTRIAAVMGGGGGALVGAAAGLGGALVVLPVAIGAGAVGGGIAFGFRAMYRHYLKEFTKLLNQMLSQVAVHAKTGGSFSLPGAPSPATPPKEER